MWIIPLRMKDEPAGSGSCEQRAWAAQHVDQHWWFLAPPLPVQVPRPKWALPTPLMNESMNDVSYYESFGCVRRYQK